MNAVAVVNGGNNGLSTRKFSRKRSIITGSNPVSPTLKNRIRKTGVELIADERREQIEKHGRTIEDDVRFNVRGQLLDAAETLIQMHGPRGLSARLPKGWNMSVWNKMVNKPYEERLIIAGALIAAELDRLNYDKKTLADG